MSDLSDLSDLSALLYGYFAYDFLESKYLSISWQSDS
ncbi:hypothetical protein HCH_01451 [Hahella chejuensis KCTC 2396]|uniref:Uncharacterized protein n=1 Tax=Hahella chejuensis (strain KCTC 2396) TaxID=349521 RepID=Q2SM13_HAHCH|nr:hypothetical protein HCH_01451 [Hahella chejuensis KCTC 2396]